MRAFIVAPATPLQARKVANSVPPCPALQDRVRCERDGGGASRRAQLAARYGEAPAEDADVIVALGGDGLMLQTLHRHLRSRIPIYGMNRGSVGFLMNDYHEDDLLERLDARRGHA